ncbi:MAG: nicotinate-nucleotide adenylyltransferase [Flavobacteriaceae bacterium]|nr:nicotinate-nucleotide adenylyltransferase [Bacteroidia bacterium]MBT8288892.1 nicotinate-nucleotide adenylyltransferase [Bacteroidia bacterium]NNF74075.1 nicotinate-nucleotide adenylyltransferase [Flavobacteriaceae bacterium]NNK73567.1 nicotinate-nucleotide adenylyltransferase [Flavobacteriaceae bacterium]
MEKQGKGKKIGLFFGSFNPIHIGHLVIANHLAEYSDLDQVWFVITPHSPFKAKRSLLEDHHRYQMVNRAVENYQRLRACDIEFGLPQPNYTINTMTYLQEKYPNDEFALIMGADNLKSFHKWKNYELLILEHDIYVYPRLSDHGEKSDLFDHDRVKHINAPIMEISSTFIRQAIKEGKQVRPMLPENVWVYLDEMNFYKK